MTRSTAGVNALHVLPLRLEGVCYEARDRRLIDRISLEIHAGPRTVMLGANGSGKSLTLRLCHGLIRPSAGRVRWLGPEAEEAGRHQAMVFQRPVMLRRSAVANLDYALALRRVPRGERRARVAEALEKTGLVRIAKQPARVLSWGEQQRLALARAWALKPEVLFLDEPTANLDPAATRAIEAVINAIHRTGTKIVMTTHDLGQARRLADEIVFLHEGQLIEHGSAEAFFERPKSPEARAFLEGRLWTGNQGRGQRCAQS